MNTEQNYVGRGTNATPPPQAAHNEGKPSKMPDIWSGVIGQIKELLLSSNSTVILLVVDQSTTNTIYQQGSNNSNITTITTGKQEVGHE